MRFKLYMPCRLTPPSLTRGRDKSHFECAADRVVYVGHDLDVLQLPDHVVEDGEVHGERVAAADDVVRPEGGVWFHWRSFKQLISVLAIVNIWLSSKKGKFEVVWALYPGFAGFVPSVRATVFPECVHKPC